MIETSGSKGVSGNRRKPSKSKKPFGESNPIRASTNKPNLFSKKPGMSRESKRIDNSSVFDQSVERSIDSGPALKISRNRNRSGQDDSRFRNSRFQENDRQRKAVERERQEIDRQIHIKPKFDLKPSLAIKKPQEIESDEIQTTEADYNDDFGGDYDGFDVINSHLTLNRKNLVRRSNTSLTSSSRRKSSLEKKR